MVNELMPNPSFIAAHKNVQNRAPARDVGMAVVPPGAVLASFVRTLETEFIARKLLTPPIGDFSPVWFLVETERNVFLWRNGCSLCEADEFEFWVDPALLVEKRLSQLAAADGENPFINPLGMAIGSATLSTSEEREYLTAFLETLAKVAPHAHALSHVASILARQPTDKPLPKILLPQAKKSAA